MPSDKDITDAIVSRAMGRIRDRKPMPTPETPITVESCLAELRELFPDTWLSIEVSWKPVIGAYYFIRIYGQPKQIEATATLDEAMAHIRAWKESR